MNIETVLVSDLALDPVNARKHPVVNLDAIKGSLQKFGQQKPIVVDKKNIVIAGNGTLVAAKALGWNEIKIVRTELEGYDAAAFALADNRTSELAEWDMAILAATIGDLQLENFDLEGIGFDSDFLDSLIPEQVQEGLVDDDAIPENVETRAKPGDLWILGDHRLICGDSTDALLVKKLLQGEEPILMVTDPPYGVEYDANWRNETGLGRSARAVGKVTNDDRADWTAVWALFNPQVMYVWHAGKFAKEVQVSLENCDYKIISQIIWAKPNFAISRGDYHWKHEPCWYAVKEGKTHNWQGSRSENTLWEIEMGCKEKTGHSTEKPVECMEKPIRNNSKAGQLIVDPFLGSGSTLIACEKTRRKCYGIEIAPHYCDVILARWEKFTGKEAVLST